MLTETLLHERNSDISKCQGGKFTDSYIAVNCGLLNYIQSGDVKY